MTDKMVCKELLEKLLNIKIKKIDIPEDQKTINLLLDSKGIRLDIYVQDENNTVYNVEMQRGNNRSLPQRLRYYQANIDLDFINKGEDYGKLVKTYIIFICTFDMFNEGMHKYTFENICIENNNIRLNDGTKKIILNTKGVCNDLDYELLEFLEYVEASNEETVKKSKGTLVKNIHNVVKKVKNDVSMEVEFMTLLQRDKEKMEEGREEGKLEGIKLTKRVLKLANEGKSLQEIAKRCETSIDIVKEIIE